MKSLNIKSREGLKKTRYLNCEGSNPRNHKQLDDKSIKLIYESWRPKQTEKSKDFSSVSHNLLDLFTFIKTPKGK